MNKTSGQLHRILFQDTISVVDSVETEFLRGYYITNIPNDEDSFYVKLEVDHAFDDGNFFINPIYNVDNEALGPDNPSERRTAVIFENSNIQNTTNSIPSEFGLMQNYPNPFNPTTTIQYNLPSAGVVKIKIYNIQGREITTLLNEFKNAGSYSINFDGTNFSSGVYYYRIESNEFSQTKRMLLIK